jgi:hypothetical protein
MDSIMGKDGEVGSKRVIFLSRHSSPDSRLQNPCNPIEGHEISSKASKIPPKSGTPLFALLS